MSTGAAETSEKRVAKVARTPKKKKFVRVFVNFMMDVL